MEHILQHIKAFVFDCDGVMTNGTVIIDAKGEGLRNFNIKDGYAVQHAVKQGYPFAILSGGNGQSIYHRFNSLGVIDIYLSQSHKEATFLAFCKKYNLLPSEVAYMGDDMPDIPVLSICGIPTCPRDAVSDVKKVCNWISSRNGGEACVRELIETTMKLQNTWYNDDTHHF